MSSCFSLTCNVCLVFQLVTEQKTCDIDNTGYVQDCYRPNIESCASACTNVSSLFIYGRQGTGEENKCHCYHGASGGTCSQKDNLEYDLYSLSSNEMLAPPKAKEPSMLFPFIQV